MGTNIQAAIVRLALRQHRNVTRKQLLGLGLGARAIAYRIRAGDLHPVHRGVYAVGTPARTALERASAAVLACGPTAALSHLAALALWGLRSSWPTRFDVTVRSDRRRKGIKVHLCSVLAPRDLRIHQGIRVTSPARTLLDCAPQLTERGLTRAVNEALVNRTLKRAQLSDVLARNPHHPGAKLLAPFATDLAGPTRSELEDRFKDLCTRFGLPAPKFNVRVGGYEVDALFEQERVIVELDSWTFHRSRDSFERDRRRDADTLASGHVTVRVTWERLTVQPAREAKRLLAILAARRA